MTIAQRSSEYILFTCTIAVDIALTAVMAEPLEVTAGQLNNYESQHRRPHWVEKVLKEGFILVQRLTQYCFPRLNDMGGLSVDLYHHLCRVLTTSKEPICVHQCRVNGFLTY